jgi:hypothetical protein
MIIRPQGLFGSRELSLQRMSASLGKLAAGRAARR